MLGAMITTLSASAQGWTKPEVETCDMQVGEVMYLYNKDTNGFLHGHGTSGVGPHWGTRACADGDKVEMIKILDATVANIADLSKETVHGEEDFTEADGQTFVIQEFVTAKNRWDEVWFGTGDYGTIWVDRQNDINSNVNFVWTIEKQSNGAYRIKASERAFGLQMPADKETAKCKGWLGAIPSVDGDTYALFFTEGYEEEAFVDWYFVKPENVDFDAFKAANDLYVAAMKLGKAIEDAEAECPGIDLTDEKAQYNNLESTIEQLNNATESVSQKVTAWKSSEASLTNPADITGSVPNHDFEGSFAGWTSTTGCQNNTTATNKAQEEGSAATGHFWENWNPSSYKGKMYTTLTGLKNGVYSVQMAAFNNTDQGGAFVYANSDSVEVVGTLMKNYFTYALVTDGTLEIGLKQPTAVSNWMGIDNVQVFYYGAGSDACQKYFEESSLSKVDVDNVVAHQAVITAAQQAFAQCQSNTSMESLAALTTAITALNESAAAYGEFVAQMDAVETYLSEHPDFESPYTDFLYDYIQDEDLAPGSSYLLGNGTEVSLPHGSGAYILKTLQLSNEEVVAEAQSLAEWLSDAIKNALVPGADATYFITNPDFETGDTQGWTFKPSDDSGAKSTSNATYVMEGSSGNYLFNIWSNGHAITQTIEGLPNGVYELQAIVGSSEGCNQVFLLGNGLHKGIELVGNGAGDTQTVGTEGSMYVLVTDGTLTIGAVGPFNNNGVSDGYSETGDHWWYKVDNFRLTYWGKDGEKAAEVLNLLIPDAEDLQQNLSYQTAPTSEALLLAVEAGYNVAKDFDKVVVVFDALQQAMDDAKEFDDALNALNDANVVLASTITEYSATADPAVVDKANNLHGEVDNLLNDASEATLELVNNKTEEVKTVAAELRVPAGYLTASDENPYDMTNLLVNPSFETAEGENDPTTGWSGTAMTVNDTAKSNAEHYNKTFDTYQTIYSLPAGTYKVEVQGYYRAGDNGANDYKASIAEDAAAKQNVFLYAKTSETNQASTPICFEAAGMLTAIPDGAEEGNVSKFTPDALSGTTYCVPQTMASAAVWFELADGTGEPLYYMNSIYVKVAEEESLTIGVCKKQGIANDWAIFNGFRLTYYGKESAHTQSDDPLPVESISTEASAQVVSVFSLGGTRLTQPQRGINILRMSDGTVRKVYVK